MRHDGTGLADAGPGERSLLETLTESTDDSLWMFSPDWTELRFVNSAYEDIFGGTVEELAEDPSQFLTRTHPADRERVSEGMATLSAGEATDIEFRVNPDTDYGTWVWVQGQPVFEDGELTALVGYTRDITERKGYQQDLERKQAELERANQSLREFAYIASHDLQEPLRMVSSYIELLDVEYGEDLDAEAREYMDFAVDGARRMKAMIDSLLEYSRVHTDAADFEPIDVEEVLEETLQDLELHITDHDATVTVEDLPRVRADRDQLRQVFQNLVKNAIDHADGTGATVEVGAEDLENAVEFSVTDDGPGIPEAHQESIFGIFSRGTSASESTGTGIGLAVAKRIVHRHGGEIWVDSADETGTTIAFTIPKTPPVTEVPEQ